MKKNGFFPVFLKKIAFFLKKTQKK